MPDDKPTRDRAIVNPTLVYRGYSIRRDGDLFLIWKGGGPTLGPFAKIAAARRAIDELIEGL